jgi:hypothetical protein
MTATTKTGKVNLTAKRRVLRPITVNLVPRSWAAIKSAASVFELSQTEAINKGAALMGEAADAVANGGGLYIRRSETDKLERITFL